MAAKDNYSEDLHDSMRYHEEYRDKETEKSPEIPAPEKEKFRIIGSYTPRVDAERMVTGQAPFAHDIKLRGMLHAKILRSPHPAAEIVSVDLSKAQSMPGVKAAHQLEKGKIFYAGQQVSAVAAVDEKTAEEAVKAIKVKYRPLPFVVSVEKAMEKGAPQVLEDTPNVNKFYEYDRGDVEKGFQEADVVLERTYQTAVEIHHPAETHASVARWRGDRLTVWDSTQAIFNVRDGLARALNVPASKIKVIKNYMGGGFGSKLGLNDYTVAAAKLAKIAGRPVKIALSRQENSLTVGNRPSTMQTIKGGIKKDGTLTALSMKNYTCGGIRRGDRCAEPYIDLYRCPHLKIEEYSVYTNTGAARPTRAPGHVQGTFALDGFLDELASQIDMDPLKLRQKNYTTKNEGDTGIPYSSKGLDKCYQIGAEKIGWHKRNKKPGEGNGKIRRGLGMGTQIWWGVGRPQTLADIKIHPDGSVEVVCGTQDLGTGTKTYMAVITAETLGLKPPQVAVKLGSTEYPWCGSSGGSTTTPSVAPAVRDAAVKASDFLKKMAAQKLETASENILIEDEAFINQKNPHQSISFKELVGELSREKVFRGEYVGRPSGYAYNTFGAHFAEVEVDMETGKTKVIKVVAVHEVGRVMNKQTAESQVVGGITQGVSTSLFEERVVDDETGTVINPNLTDYKIATSCDTPHIEAYFVDMVDPRINNLGTKGLGEPPRIPINAAVGNAIYNATGVRLRKIPMTPDKFLKALKEKESER
ncbi:MAG: xanthine dehydrogenase family protein molybdopterin-binding subunit [Candidatus Aminicenantes bacterium]